MTLDANESSLDELIKRVNTLTVDKNRLRQKLAQLSTSQQQRNSVNQFSPTGAHSFTLNQLTTSQSNNQLHQNSQETIVKDSSNSNNNNSANSSDSYNLSNQNKNNQSSSNIIAGVECATSCEEDLLFMNELYKKRLDEYDENWVYVQSKATALLSELESLQENYSMLKKEKLDLEKLLMSSCDENDKLKNEHQTVVLNYETQLSELSQHLSMITSQVSLGDDLARAQPH